LLVSILRQGDVLIASIHTALNDAELVQFQHDLIRQIGDTRSRGVVIDIAAVDVLDSFGSRCLLDVARMARLRGAETVIVGVQPDVAFAIVELGMLLDVPTALDLEEGLEQLEARTAGRRDGRSALEVISNDTTPLWSTDGDDGRRSPGS
jgi:rsbT antagonist protein RsbS